MAGGSGRRKNKGRGRGRGGGAGVRGLVGGRGGRGRGRLQQEPMIPNWLNVLNDYNTKRMVTYLDKEDRQMLGKAYLRFAPPKPSKKQQEKMQRMQKEKEEKIKKMQKEKRRQEQEKARSAKDEAELEMATGKVVENPREGVDKDDDIKLSHREDQAEEATKEEELVEAVDEKNKKEDVSNEEKKVDDGSKGKTDTGGMSPSDPHTLLARLNTKRLFHRIRYLKKVGTGVSSTDAYPIRMTTEQIAIQEWKDVLIRYTEANTRAMEEKRNALEAMESDGEDNDGEMKIRYDYTIPASCELLMFSPCPRAVAVLASYPRSGNSLMRTLYEKITLRVTGSDMLGGLAKHDLVGEMAVQQNCVQFVKTHYPERMGSPPFPVNRAVLLVRNPYDAMESYFNLMMTNTHTTSLSDEQRDKYKKVFEDMTKKEILVWRDFHEYWLKQKIPILVIRYEDLIRETDIVISKVIKFTLEINDMKFFESRIDRCIREEQIERLGSYRPRSGGIGKSLKKYSPELLQEINQGGIIETMAKFGYSEMLVPNPEEWKLEPLDQYGVLLPGTPGSTLTINHQGLVRGPKRQTNWMALRMQMEGKTPGKCTCAQCTGRGR